MLIKFKRVQNGNHIFSIQSCKCKPKHDLSFVYITKNCYQSSWINSTTVPQSLVIRNTKWCIFYHQKWRTSSSDCKHVLLKYLFSWHLRPSSILRLPKTNKHKYEKLIRMFYRYWDNVWILPFCISRIVKFWSSLFLSWAIFIIILSEIRFVPLQVMLMIDCKILRRKHNVQVFGYQFVLILLTSTEVLGSYSFHILLSLLTLGIPRPVGECIKLYPL